MLRDPSMLGRKNSNLLSNHKFVWGARTLSSGLRVSAPRKTRVLIYSVCHSDCVPPQSIVLIYSVCHSDCVPPQSIVLIYSVCHSDCVPPQSIVLIYSVCHSDCVPPQSIVLIYSVCHSDCVPSPQVPYVKASESDSPLANSGSASSYDNLDVNALCSKPHEL